MYIHTQAIEGLGCYKVPLNLQRSALRQVFQPSMALIMHTFSSSQDCGFITSEHNGMQKLVFASDPANIDSAQDHGLLPMTHVSKSQDTLSQTIPKQSLSLWGAWIFLFLCLMSPLRNTYHLRTRFDIKCHFLLQPTSALHQHFKSSLILNR